MRVQRNNWMTVMGGIMVAGVLAGCSDGDTVPDTGQVALADATPVTVAEPMRPPFPEPGEAAPAIRPSAVTYAEAEAVFRKGRYGEAAEMLAAFTSTNPEHGAGHYLLGLSAWKSGDHTGAEQALMRAVELDGSSVKALTNLARVQLESGRARDALVHIEAATDLRPESHEVWRVLGNVNSELGRADEALEAYRQALMRNGSDAWSMNNYGLVLIRDGRFAEALAPLSLAVELTPASAMFRNNLGVALERSGYLGEARRTFAAAVEADSSFTRASTNLERVEALLGDAPGATIDLESLSRSFAEMIVDWRLLDEHGC